MPMAFKQNSRIHNNSKISPLGMLFTAYLEQISIQRLHIHYI